MKIKNKNTAITPARNLAQLLKTGVALSATMIFSSALQAQITEPPLQNPPAQSNPSLTTPSEPTDANGGTIKHSAKEFLQEANQANQTEIAMANIAENKSQNTQVKELAKMVIDDHQKNLAQVQALAQSHNVTLDPNLTFMNKHAVESLQKDSEKNGGADFDKDFTKVMLKDHVKCIKRFERVAEHATDSSIKTYAQTTLPALQMHLQHAKDAARAVGVEDSTINSILKGLPEDADGKISANP
jgi:putative membrane protein